MSFFSTICVLLSIVLIAAAVAGRFFLRRGSNGEPMIGTWSGFAGLIIAGLVIAIIPWLAFYAEPGMIYRVVYPTGGTTVIDSEGFHFRGVGQLQDFKKVLTVKIGDANGADFTESIPLSGIQFNDSVNAEVGGTFRFNLPAGADFEKLAVDFRTQSNLVHSCLIPTTLEALQNAARMISAQEYVTGRGGEFQFSIQDQLSNGLFLLDQRKVKPAGTGNTQEVSEAGDGMSYVVEKRLDSNGTPIRKPSNVAAYKIMVSRATIDSVDPDSTFDLKLQQQREAAAGANIEQQEARKALYRKERVIAEGEANKEEARFVKERDQVERTTVAETEKMVAQTQREKEKIEVTITAEAERERARIEVETEKLRLEAERLRAEQVLVTKEAEAKGRELLANADNSLQLRLEAWNKAVEKMAAALGQQDKIVPEIVIGTSGDSGANSATTLLDLIMVNQARQLGLNLDDLAGKPAK